MKKEKRFVFAFDYNGNWFLLPVDKERQFYKALDTRSHLKDFILYMSELHPSEYIFENPRAFESIS